jgi:DNA-binding transcriptional LysR family regulator
MLGLSDSGVSRAVARLEARLGVDRSLRLTGEGGRFYAEDATSSRTRRLRYQRPPGGAWPLGVEIDPFFSRLVLALRLGDLLERCPDLSLELVTTEAPGDLFAHGFDVGVRFGEATGIGLIARKLLDTGILTVASPAYCSGTTDRSTPATWQPTNASSIVTLGRLTRSGPQLLPSLPESPHWYGSARQWSSSALLMVRLVGANGPADHGPIGQRSDSDT